MWMTGGLGPSGSPLCALGAADHDGAIVLFFILKVLHFLLLAQEKEAEREIGS